MATPVLVNDRNPETPDPDATLDGILERVRLDGAVFLRGEYTESWAARRCESAWLTFKRANGVSPSAARN